MNPEPDHSRLPYPVALTAQRLEAGLARGEDVLKTLLRLKDCFEASVKYLGSALLVDYFRGAAATPEHNEILLQKMVKPSLGVWVSVVVGDVSRWLVSGAKDGEAFPVARLFIASNQGQGAKPQPTELLNQAVAFVAYRNDALGHGALRSDDTYRRDLEHWQPLLRQLLDAVASLAPWRLCLVTDTDQCQSWMGPVPGETREPGIFRREQVGHFVLRRPAEYGGAETKDLYPFVCHLLDAGRTPRLHYYDSLYRYQETRKEAAMLEYDQGFKQASPEPMAGLEEVFTRELLLREFKRHQSAMREIDGRVANFSELLAQHAHITGREFALERVQKFVAENDRGLLVIEAEPGKGKTALLAHLIEETFGHYAPAPAHFFYRRTAGIQNPDVCVRSLYASLLEAHNLTEAEESRAQQDADAVFTKLTNLLANEIAPRLLPSRPQLIFIDALDESGLGSTGRTAFQRVPENIPAGVYFIVTTRPVADRASLARRDHLHWLNLDAPEFREANLRDGQLYVTAEMAGAGLGRDALAEIARLGAGNFLVLTLLCRHIRTALRSTEVADFLHRLATSGAKDMLGFIYDEFWERLSERCTAADMNVLCDVAGLFATAQAPVTADIVCECLKLRAGDWDFALRRLAEYLSVMDEEHAGARQVFYRIYHETFADFLRGKFKTHQRRFHELLGDYTLGWSAREDGYERTFSLRFAPTHLVAARRWDDVEKLLTDLTFLEAKNEAGFVFDLAGDFTNAVAALPADRPQRRILKLLGEALRREIHFIARHAKDYPQALFQVLWNNCWWYDCPDATPYYEEPDGGWKTGENAPPWAQLGTKFCLLLETWRLQKEKAQPGFFWIRSKRPPPLQLGGAQLAVLRGHENSVTSVCFSPDGRTLASGSRDKTVRVWDAASGRELAVLRGHENSVTSVCFSPDGRTLASGSWDDTVRVWDAASGRERAVLRGHENRVESVCFSPDGRTLASASHDKTVRVWDAASGRELAVLRGHENSVTSVCFSPDGRTLASGSNDKTVRLWDAASGRERAVLRGHESWVTSVCFSPDGRTLASGSGDKTVRVWDAASGNCLEVIQGFGDVQAIAAGAEKLPRWALGRNLETVIEDAAKKIPVAWFEAAVGEITTHRSGCAWAGNVANYLYLITFEGGPGKS